jgi:hypothetical protein
MKCVGWDVGRDLRPPLKLDDSVEKQYFYRKRVFQPTTLLPDCPSFGS